MNLAPDALSECAVHELMAGERPQAGKRLSDKQGGEMRAVVRAHLDARAGQ